MELIRATESDLQDLYSLYRRTADNMKLNGLNQWNWGLYPTEEMIRADVERGELYVARTGGMRPGCIHRLVIDPPLQGAGIGGDMMDDAIQILRRAGCDCVRCDTNRENKRAMRLYEKMGFRICGAVHWDDTPDEFYYAFDKPLKRETPLWPIRMTPAFRGGKLTPWGGDRLRKEFGKETEEEQTGDVTQFRADV